MTTRLFLLIIAALATPAWAAPALQVIGYAGGRGEWEWSASVTERTNGRTKEYSGPLTILHVGVCTQDGPETKIGEIRFQLSRFPAEMQATILVDGIECKFSGRLSDRYTGSMTCPDRPPLPLNIWLK